MYLSYFYVMKDAVPDKLKVALCDRFKQIRLEAGLTQPEYATKLKMTRSSVNAIEHYRYSPSISTIMKLKKNFGRSYNWIIEGK